MPRLMPIAGLLLVVTPLVLILALRDTRAALRLGFADGLGVELAVFCHVGSPFVRLGVVWHGGRGIMKARLHDRFAK